MKARESNFPWKENELDTDAMFPSSLVTTSPVATFPPFLGSGSYLLFWNFPLMFFFQAKFSYGAYSSLQTVKADLEI